MQRVIRMLVLTALISSITACDASMMPLANPNPIGYKRLFLRGVPEGNTSFAQGWRAGCDVMLSTTGGGTLRMIPVHYDTARLSTDADYQEGFRMGSTYCIGFLDYN